MITVYKYPLMNGGRFSIGLPEGAVPLTVQLQHGMPTLWAKVDTEADAKPYLVTVVGTGHEIKPEDAESDYLGTIMLDDGVFVFHYFGRRVK